MTWRIRILSNCGSKWNLDWIANMWGADPGLGYSREAHHGVKPQSLSLSLNLKTSRAPSL